MIDQRSISSQSSGFAPYAAGGADCTQVPHQRISRFRHIDGKGGFVHDTVVGRVQLSIVGPGSMTGRDHVRGSHNGSRGGINRRGRYDKIELVFHRANAGIICYAEILQGNATDNGDGQVIRPRIRTKYPCSGFIRTKSIHLGIADGDGYLVVIAEISRSFGDHTKTQCTEIHRESVAGSQIALVVDGDSHHDAIQAGRIIRFRFQVEIMVTFQIVRSKGIDSSVMFGGNLYIGNQSQVCRIGFFRNGKRGLQANRI